MRKLLSLLLCFLLSLGLSACAKPDEPNPPQENKTKITDALGRTSLLSKDSKIAVCYGSFADCLLLSGIDPVAVTDDAIEEHGLDFDDKTQIIGSVKQINLETLIACNPDYVVLSADLAAHLKLEESLKEAGFNYGYFRIDTFGDYKAFMGQFCALSEREDLFSKNVLETEKRINAIRQKIPENNPQTVLLLRVFSTGMKAKSDDNIAGLILKEFGLKNLADLHPSLLEDISLEQIVTDDPDFIFVSTMGNVEDAEKYLKNNITSNPVWEELKAIKNDRYVILPKELFHYKPNEKWDKAYEFIAKLIFPEVFG